MEVDMGQPHGDAHDIGFGLMVFAFIGITFMVIDLITAHGQHIAQFVEGFLGW